MGAFGSVIGGIMTILSLFLASWAVFTFTSNMISLFFFIIFGIVGGLSLGALNSRKAKYSAKYKNEYTSYAGMSFAAIILLAVYYILFAKSKVEDKLVSDSDLDAMQVILLSALSGVLGFLGVGLTVANAIAEE